MYEKILATICTAAVTLGVIWFVCRRDSDRRAGSRTKSNSRRIRDDISRAEENNKELADAERRTRETIDRARETSRRTSELIGRAEGDTDRSQELIGKAKHILSSAKHTD